MKQWGGVGWVPSFSTTFTNVDSLYDFLYFLSGVGWGEGVLSFSTTFTNVDSLYDFLYFLISRDMDLPRHNVVT